MVEVKYDPKKNGVLTIWGQDVAAAMSGMGLVDLSAAFDGYPKP
ncbi:MAG: hypothetical protein VXW78_04770 [Pseudomonadota bacterium]|nr:hypothetical protein [Pseudomonadota bacterium]